MSPQLSSWAETGSYFSFGPFGHQVFVLEVGNPVATAEKTLLLIHGFPESSYSFHAVLDGLKEKFDRIVLLDILGYGLSDKPTTGYTYSLFEQADVVFAAWAYLGVRGGHMLAHDMGDSVATEIVYRHQHNLIPGWFDQGLRSVTFTNGSMILSLAKLRITQKILLSSYGHLMKNVSTHSLFSNQVKSAHGNNKLSQSEIDILWESNALQDGHQKMYLVIKYLNDRKRFENTRWLPALAQCELPIHICWGDDDAVAQVAMAHHLKEKVCQNAKLTIMNGVGHFGQLGSPEKWLTGVLGFYN